MHGKNREKYKAKMRDPKISKILAQKAEQWYALMGVLGDRRRSMASKSEDENAVADPTAVPTTLKLLEKALLVNPDPLNLWNHRRELMAQELTAAAPAKGDGGAPAKAKGEPPSEASILERERGLTQAALERNPKAYGPWFHRKWCLQRFRPARQILEQELGLTTLFLKADERNFHCWNYRRFVVACLGNSWDGEWRTTTNTSSSLMGQQVVEKGKDENSHTAIPSELLQSEFDFTTEKIQENFSNSSAFHYRSQLLDPLCGGNDQAFADLLETEFELVENAVVTEPDDQTAWWYYSLLLDKLVAKSDHPDDDDESLLDRFRDKLEEHAELFRELLEDMEDDGGGGKWVILGSFKVLQVLGDDGNDDDATDGDEDNKNERQRLLERLQEIDPYRTNRYRYLGGNDQ